jgi:hypothetical protein
MKNLTLPAVILCAAAMSALAHSEEKARGTPLCMTLPRVAVGDGAPIINAFSEQLRKQIATTLAGPMVEPRGVASRLAVQARAEASDLKCHYLLNVNFTHTPNSKIGKHSAQTAMEVGRVASSVASSVGSMSSRTSGAVGAASSIGGLFGNHSGSSSRSDVGSGFYPVGKNDKISMTYSLELVDGEAVVKKGEFAGKVSKDNEPLVDTYIEKLANDELQAISQ